MNIIIMVAQLLLGLTILVFIHELGHFLAAKMFKTKVEKFYLFFDFLFPMPNVLNFALWKKKIGETEYGFGWFPLGGYVSIAGMVDETQDANQLPSEPQPWEYRSKRSWQKMIIILGGIIFNLVFAIIIFSGLLKFDAKEYLSVNELNKNGGVIVSQVGKEFGFKDGDKILSINGSAPERIEDLTPISSLFGANYKVERIEQSKAITTEVILPNNYFKKFHKDLFTPLYNKVFVRGVQTKSNAEAAGLKPDDQIIGLDSTLVSGFDYFTNYLSNHKSSRIDVKVIRDSQVKILDANVDESGKLGIEVSVSLDTSKYKLTNYSNKQVLKYSVENCYRMFVMQAITISKLFTREMKAKESVGGIFSMAQAYGSSWDWTHFWTLTAVISVALAFMNLIPIPGLDGGHAVIIIIEAITRKPISPKVLQIIQNIGMYLILALTIFVFYIDIERIVSKFVK